jgi:hypothetical protein
LPLTSALAWTAGGKTACLPPEKHGGRDEIPTRKMDADRPIRLGGRVIFRTVGRNQNLKEIIRMIIPGIQVTKALFLKIKELSRPAYILIILTLAYMIGLASAAFQSHSYLLAQLENVIEYKKLISDLELEAKQASVETTVVKKGVIDLNMIVKVEVTRSKKVVFSDYNREKLKIEDADAETTPHIRFDNLILIISTAFVLGMVGSFVAREGAIRRFDGPAQMNNPPPPQPSKTPVTTLDLAKGNTEEVLAASVLGAEKRAEVLFSRSTLLLAGGILMAFIGVLVFYITLPDFSYGSHNVLIEGSSNRVSIEDTKNSTVLSHYLLRAIRPMGVLMFLEAIAWFLLRQYRELIEDYKVFHRVYLRRMNLLAAYKVSCNGNRGPEELFLAAALLEDDLSGKLKKDETTENLERIKINDPNPVFSLVTSIINATVPQKMRERLRDIPLAENAKSKVTPKANPKTKKPNSQQDGASGGIVEEDAGS